MILHRHRFLLYPLRQSPSVFVWDVCIRLDLSMGHQIHLTLARLLIKAKNSSQRPMRLYKSYFTWRWPRKHKHLLKEAVVLNCLQNICVRFSTLTLLLLGCKAVSNGTLLPPIHVGNSKYDVLRHFNDVRHSIDAPTARRQNGLTIDITNKTPSGNMSCLLQQKTCDVQILCHTSAAYCEKKNAGTSSDQATLCLTQADIE